MSDVIDDAVTAIGDAANIVSDLQHVADNANDTQELFDASVLIGRVSALTDLLQELLRANTGALTVEIIFMTGELNRVVATIDGNTGA